MAGERPTASNERPDVRSAVPARPEHDGLTRAEARALTRCAPLAPGGAGGRDALATTSWVERADRLGVGSLRRRVASHAALAGMPADDLAELQVAVSEALTNVVLHAYRDSGELGDVRVEVEVRGGSDLVVRVRDYGVGIGPRPDSPGLGVGLVIIARLSRSCEVRRCDDCGTEVSMCFALLSGDPGAGARPAPR